MSEEPLVRSGDEPTQPTGAGQSATGHYPHMPGWPDGYPWWGAPWGAWWGPPGPVPPGGAPYGPGPYGFGAPPPRPRQHPVLGLAAGVAAAALMALGVGIGYIVWGAPTASAGARSSLPPRVRPVLPGTGSSGATTTGSSPKGFLGVEVSASPASTAGTPGAHVVAVVPGSPAAKAGLAAGDTITSFGTRRVVSSITLEFDTQSDAPGTKVSVGWSTSTGKHEHATVTLVRRPSGGTSVG